MVTQAKPSERVSFGDFELDCRTAEIRRNGSALKLQPQPAKVLTILVGRAGEVVTRQELAEQVWGAETYVDFEHGLNFAIRQIRSALQDDVENPRYVETIPKRGYRFIAPITSNGHEVVPALAAAAAGEPARWKVLVPSLLLVFVLVLAGVIWYLRQPHHPLEKDTVVLGDFINRTGDSVFDGTLREGLSVQLEQSPLLRVIPEEQIHDTLRMMGRIAGVEHSPDVAREICQRNDAAVTLEGSISSIGTRYDLVLRAIDCGNGNLLASTEAPAQDKDHVLDAVSKLASDMREKLGESLSTVRQYNTPLADATTPSLPALRCYTQGLQSEIKDFDFKASLPWFQKAIDLDPNFAMAYWTIGDAYGESGETNSGKPYVRKAFELRGPISQREKWLIEGGYYFYVPGDLLKARQSFELMAKLYPDSQYAHNSVADIAESLGQYDIGLAEYQRALHLPPRSSFLYRDVANTFLLIDRVDEAQAQLRDAHAVGLDGNLAAIAYSIAFYREDRTEMARQVTAAAGKPGIEDLLLALDADSSAYYGQLGKARALSEHAADSAERAGGKEIRAQYYAASGIREGLFGNANRAREQATIASGYSGGRDLAYGAALAYIFAGDLNRGEAQTEELGKRLPKDTIVKCNYLPTLRAKLALMHSKPQEAIDILTAAASCELGLPVYSYYNWPNLYPAYVRGEAYLAAHRGPEAAAEFHKILTHRGLVLNEPIGALSQLQLGRAYVLSGDLVKGRAAYQKFMDLWKDADPDIPILKQAKTEYAKLPEVRL